MTSRNRTKEILDNDADQEEMLATWAIWKQHQEEGEGSASRMRGSVVGRKTIFRNRSEGHNRLFEDYFAENCVYPPNYFRRRFRMRRPLFLRIQDAVEKYDDYFKQKKDSAGIPGLSSLQKVTAAIRILAYGSPADALDDYLRLAESTAIESLEHFVQAVIAIFSEEYLRKPNSNDVARLLSMAEARGFPGMLGSIDCMHWKWKNCPAAWKGMYTGHVHEPTIILEAVASQDLWIWHAFFGLPGSNNDINVLDRSPVFSDIANGRATACNFIVNGHTYNMGYYLADGIYPPWSTLVKTLSSPQGNKQKNFAKAQAAARKDVERAFGVLQARFAIVRGPARFWRRELLSEIMTTCIILHNMIVEDERDAIGFDEEEIVQEISISREPTQEFHQFIAAHHRIRNRETHSQLQRDLIEHLWEFYGDQ